MIRTADMNRYSPSSTISKLRLLRGGNLWRTPDTPGAISATNVQSSLVYERSLLRPEVGLTMGIEEALQALIRQGISLSKPANIRSYLLKYPNMVDVLGLVAKVALDRFDRGSKLSLELYEDPEAEDAYLTLYVRQADYAVNLLDQIEEISRLVDASLENQVGWLLITTDFRAAE